VNGKQLAAAAFVAASAATSGAAMAQLRWDLPTAYPATNFHTENIQQFAVEVENTTFGKLRIQVYPDASLVKAPDIKGAVASRQVQIGEILWVNYENENPLFGIDGVPFLATSYAHAMKLWRASRDALDRELGKQGMKVLFSVPWPPQGVYSKRTLNSASDMKGLRWRAYNPTTVKIAELVGAQPVTIQAAEVNQALATGVIDSMITSCATGYDTRVYEHIANFYDAQAWLPKNAVIVNARAFAALDRVTRMALLKAAADAEARGWKMSEQKTDWYIAQLKKNGMRVLPPGPQLQSDLRKIGELMLADWLRKTGSEGEAVIIAYRK
jgi:TRAP-type C4-dicarboxylate transport system substrate-binding protein